MRVDCEKRYLQKAVSLVERSTGKKLALPVLGKVLLEVKNKNLFIKGTNLEIWGCRRFRTNTRGTPRWTS